MNALVFVVSLCLFGIVASQIYPGNNGNNGGLPNADTACSGDQAKQGQEAINQMCTSIKSFTQMIPNTPATPNTPDQLKKVQDCFLSQMTQYSGTCFQMPGSEQVSFQTLCDGSKTEERSKMGCCYIKQIQASGGSGVPKMDFASLATSCGVPGTNPLSGMGGMGRR